MAATREPVDELTRLSISFRIAYADITFGEELGRGGFGIVKAGRWKYNQVAVKQFHLTHPSVDALREFQHEADLMLRLDAPNIVRLYGICNETPYALVMEYMEGGSLYGLLQSTQPLDWQARQRIALDISRGLAYLHSERILHLDLKSLNVLLDGYGKAKLCDFGLSKFKRESSTLATRSTGGSLPWMAPELFERYAVATTKTDIYAYSMVLWEIASRRVPFADAHSPDLIPSWVLRGDREEIPPDCPVDFGQLIRRCWDAAQDIRPTAEDAMLALEHLLAAAPPLSPFPAIAALVAHPIVAGAVPAASSEYRGNLGSMIPAVALPPVPPPGGASPAASTTVDPPARVLPPIPAPAVLPKAASPAGLFGRRPAAPKASPDLLRLLRLVAEGEQDQAEAMLQANPELAWGSGCVTDLSERTFVNITAFQYALWALDWHMWRMILKYLPKDVAAEQLAELEANSTEHGTYFSFTPLIQALDNYVSNFNVWYHAHNWKAIEQAWFKGVGGQQKLLVAHGINEYCRPDRSFNPVPTFLEPTLPRTRKCFINRSDDDVLSAVLDGGKIGDSFAFIRAGWVLAAARNGKKSRAVATCDLKSLQKLSSVRTQQLEKMKAKLSQYLTSMAAPAIVEPSVKALPPRLAPTVSPKTASPAGLFGRRSAVPAESPELLRLLLLVVEGEQDQAEEMLRANPELAWGSGRVTDLSERTFANITAFQYALWALDWHMWRMILRYLPPDVAAQQLAELEANSTEHGTHFSFIPFIQALDNYVRNWQRGALDWEAQKDAWCKNVGGHQKLLVAHGINEYCRPDRSFDPTPTFLEPTLPRTRKGYVNKEGDNVLSVYYKGGKIGDSFAISRGVLGAAMAGDGIIPRFGVRGSTLEREILDWRLPTRADLKSLQKLSSVRTQQLEELKIELAEYYLQTPTSGMRA